MDQDPDRQHQHDGQQKEQQPFQLLSDEDDDGEEIIISIDDEISPISPFSSSNLEGASSSNDHNQKNPTISVMKNKKQKEEKRNKVVSFRMSERDYARHLSMAKLCYENGLTKGPDIVSYIRLSMECLSRYITSQAEVERSAEKGGEQQQQLQIKKEGSVEQHDLNNYHTMTASSSRPAAAITNTAMGEHTRESMARTPPLLPPTPPLFNLHEYFQPVFDQLDELNKFSDRKKGKKIFCH
jgi:hypothetical protein